MDREISTESRVTVEEERGNGGGISRRTFIKGVGGVATAAAVLGISGLKALAQPGLPASSVPPFVNLPKATLLLAYLRMQRIRKGEKKLQEMYFEGGNSFGKWTPGMRNSCHQSVGEEATCVGVTMAMQKDDYLLGTHRSHGYPLARGLEMRPWFAEFFCRVTGCNRGHGGSMHIADPSLKIIGMTGIVGAGNPIALGAAFAAMVKGSKQVAVSTCGDGAMNASGFNSSLNMAAIQDAPCVFVINNNQWGIQIPARWDNQLARTGKDLSVRAQGFGIPGYTVDGMDFAAVYTGAKHCIDRARAGKGPSLLECKTYRYHAHSSPRPHEVTSWPHNRPEELEYWLRRDPIKRFERVVTQGGIITEAELAKIAKQVDDEIVDGLKFALASRQPTVEEGLGWFIKNYGA